MFLYVHEIFLVGFKSNPLVPNPLALLVKLEKPELAFFQFSPLTFPKELTGGWTIALQHQGEEDESADHVQHHVKTPCKNSLPIRDESFPLLPGCDLSTHWFR